MNEKKMAKKTVKKKKVRELDPDVVEWWTTSIIDMEPNRIKIRGHDI